MAGSLREQMPQVAAIIDDLRRTFGQEYIDKIIRAGMKGQPVFFASENGHTLGTPMPQGVRVGTDAHGCRYLIDGLPAGDARVDPKENRRERYWRRMKERMDASREAVQTSAQTATARDLAHRNLK